MSKKAKAAPTPRTGKSGKNGRESAYDPKRYPAIAAAFMRKGGTIAELAAAFTVTERTIYSWRQKHPEFLQAISESKKSADAEVENSLFLLTKDRRVTEMKKIFRRDPETGEAVQIGAESYEKVIPASLSAILVWLFNRTDDWRRNPDNGKDWDTGKDPLNALLAGMRDGDHANESPVPEAN